jgi:DNA-directed RNA polymerase
MKDFLSSCQNLRRELTEKIEKTQMELQTVEVYLDKRTRDVEEKTASVKEDITSNKRKKKILNLHSGGWSPNWVHSAHRPFTGLLYLPRVIVRMEKLVE